MKNLFSLSAVCAAALLATSAMATAVPAAPDATITMAKKEDRSGEGAGHPVSEPMPATVAKKEDRSGEGAGHPVSEPMPATLAKREKEQRGNDDGGGHRLGEELRGDLLARNETSHGGKRRPAGKGGV